MNNTFKIASLAFWFFAITLNLNSKQDFQRKYLMVTNFLVILVIQMAVVHQEMLLD